MSVLLSYWSLECSPGYNVVMLFRSEAVSLPSTSFFRLFTREPLRFLHYDVTTAKVESLFQVVLHLYLDFGENIYFLKISDVKI